MKKKNIALLLSAVLVLVGAVGFTIAWLTDGAGPVNNTFTVGNIDIDLTETTGDTYKMIPGFTYDKDPTVTVEGKSEPCWLFVKVTERGGVVTVTEEDETVEKNFDSFVDYAIADGWTALPDVEGVFYRQVGTSEDAQAFSVIADNKVVIKSDVTKDMMDALVTAVNTEPPATTVPTLSFKAAAVQLYEKNTAATDEENKFSVTDAYALVEEELNAAS